MILSPPSMPSVKLPAAPFTTTPVFNNTTTGGVGVPYAPLQPGTYGMPLDSNWSKIGTGATTTLPPVFQIPTTSGWSQPTVNIPPPPIVNMGNASWAAPTTILPKPVIPPAGINALGVGWPSITNMPSTVAAKPATTTAPIVAKK